MRSLLLVMFLATGCMGQIGSTTPGDDDDQPGVSARQAYEKVHPIMLGCGGTTCHAIDATASTALSKWVTPDIEMEYAAINASPAVVGAYSEVSPILTKIDSGHQGKVYSTADRDAILDWLAAELAEATQDPSQPPPVDPAELLRTWSGCMTLANFEQAQMAELFSASQGSGRACVNCHTGGLAGFVVDSDPQQYFTTLSTSMSQLIKYFGVQNGEVTISLGAMANAGSGSIPQHPIYDVNTLAGLPALEEFYNLTKQAQTAGGCAPPTAVNP